MWLLTSICKRLADPQMADAAVTAACTAADAVLSAAFTPHLEAVEAA